jgi:hypothetical protein
VSADFKSFADFKRRVSHMTLVRQAVRKDPATGNYSRTGELVDTPNRLVGIKRPVAKINSVDIMLTTEKPDGETVLSHLQLGKASEWSFDGDMVTRDDGSGIMQYRVEARD